VFRNTVDGQTIIFKSQLLEVCLQFFAVLILLYQFWELNTDNNFWLFIQLAIGLACIKLCITFLIRYFSAPTLPGKENSNYALKLISPTLNALTGMLWGFGFIFLTRELPGIELINPWFVLIMGAIIVASYIGSAFHSRTFYFFVVPGLVLPLIMLLDMDVANEQLVLWGTLTLFALMLANTSNSVENLFIRYRGQNRQDTNLLKEFATAREQAINDHSAIERANESLKSEMNERQSFEAKIRTSEKETARILQDMLDTYFQVDGEGVITRLSQSIRLLLGHDYETLIGRHFSTLFIDNDEYNKFSNRLQKKGGILHNYEIRLKHGTGQNIWTSFNAHYSSAGNDHSDGFEGTIRDISEMKQSAEKLFQEKERLHVTLESIGDGVITTNMNGYVEYLNPVAEKMMGWTEEEVRGKHLATVFHLIDEASNKPVALPFRVWLSKGRRKELSEPAILVNRHKEKAYTIELSGAPIRDSHGTVIGSVLVFHNVTKLRTLAQQLSYQASHDALTGLINRREFELRLKEAIFSAKEHKIPTAICYVDLDQFKVVNDTCGHNAGDKLLIQISNLMKDCLRSSDTLGRLGGDEFGILLIECDIDAAAKIAEKIRYAVEKFNFYWENRIFRVGTSIGIAQITENTESLTDLLSAADSACYVAKKHGRNQVHIYTADDKHIAQHHGQMHWIQRIHSALAEDRFELHFQSIQSLKNDTPGKLSGEVLLRMLDENNELIMPDLFIPAAERYQLMPAIDKWVLARALETLSTNPSSSTNWGMCTINLSGQSIGEHNLLDYILDLLDKTKVSPSIICFEITESAVISNLASAQEFIKTLKELGCRFALDDFGSGLSSFSYLKNLPVDYLKLDGELILDVAVDSASYAMVAAINNVAHVMGMETIAEHVESDEILLALKKLSIDYVQGYAIDIPVNFFWTTNKQNSQAS